MKLTLAYMHKNTLLKIKEKAGGPIVCTDTLTCHGNQNSAWDYKVYSSITKMWFALLLVVQTPHDLIPPTIDQSKCDRIMDRQTEPRNCF